MTLTEIARKLDVDETWVRRRAIEHKLSGASGNRGKKSEYSDDVFCELRRIRHGEIVAMEEVISRFYSLNPYRIDFGRYNG